MAEFVSVTYALFFWTEVNVSRTHSRRDTGLRADDKTHVTVSELLDGRTGGCTSQRANHIWSAGQYLSPPLH